MREYKHIHTLHVAMLLIICCALAQVAGTASAQTHPQRTATTTSATDTHPPEDADALFQRAKAYYFGNGVPQDDVKAEKLLERAAEAGHTMAQNNLARMYYNGRGVPQNSARAAEWFRRAAEQGLATAQYNLGVLYADGNGVAQDYGNAAKWFRRAANQGIQRQLL